MLSFSQFITETTGTEYPVEETPLKKKRRLAGGFTKIVHVDAKKFRDSFEKEHREKLDWHPGRMEHLKNVPTLDDHPKVSLVAGKVDVIDGRHRISTAANSGKTIRVATEPHVNLHHDLLAQSA